MVILSISQDVLSLHEIADRAARAAVEVDELLACPLDVPLGRAELLMMLRDAAQWLGTFGHVLAEGGRLGYCRAHRAVFSTERCAACEATR